MALSTTLLFYICVVFCYGETMPMAKCKICSGEFYAKPFWVKRGFGIYCSAKCQHEGRKTGKTIQCFICGKEKYKTLKALRHSKSKKYFCGKSCQTVWRNSIVYIGKNHPNWKAGEYTYRDIMLRNKITQVCKKCKTTDKRILVVHHLDRNRKNNKLSNLVWLCHNCHFLAHHYDIERVGYMVPMV